MRPAITGVMHYNSGLTVRVNGHSQGELITPVLLVVVHSGPRSRCEVERDSCCRDFFKSDIREVCHLCKEAAIAYQYELERERRRMNG